MRRTCNRPRSCTNHSAPVTEATGFTVRHGRPKERERLSGFSAYSRRRQEARQRNSRNDPLNGSEPEESMSISLEEAMSMADRAARKMRIPDIEREDARQCARAAAWLALSRSPDAGPAYVDAYIRGGIRDWLRKTDWSSKRLRQEGKAPTIEYWVPDDAVTCAPPQHDAAERAEGLRAIDDAVSGLTDKMRRVVRLRLRGILQVDIARDEGVTTAAIYRRWTVALEQIRQRGKPIGTVRKCQ